MADPIAPSVRAELDQTPEWWDRQYRALERKRIPRDAASHEDHRVETESYMTYASIVPRVRRWCTTCGVHIEEGLNG